MGSRDQLVIHLRVPQHHVEEEEYCNFARCRAPMEVVKLARIRAAG